MSTLTDDVAAATVVTRDSTFRAGLGFAMASAASFGMSGALGSPLLDAGWSSGAVTVLRVWIGALVLLPWGIHALGGRWSVLWASRRIIVGYAVLGVAAAQFCYFSAIRYMDVGPALLIEFTSPATVVVWLWLRRGQRPGPVTLAGAALAAVGLVLVLDLVSGADLSIAGVLWALGAMVGASGHFLLGGDDSTGLPPITLATAGLTLGGAGLALLGLIGVLPLVATPGTVAFREVDITWWAPILALGTITAAVSYSTGLAAIRRLGSRLASFVALSEVVAGLVFAWLLLGEMPGPIQLVGGLLILGGVVTVKLGEPTR